MSQSKYDLSRNNCQLKNDYSPGPQLQSQQEFPINRGEATSVFGSQDHHDQYSGRPPTNFPTVEVSDVMTHQRSNLIANADVASLNLSMLSNYKQQIKKRAVDCTLSEQQSFDQNLGDTSDLSVQQRAERFF